MPAHFPLGISRTPLPLDPRELAGTLARSPADVLREGYLRVVRPEGELFLFLVQGKPHGAGKLDEDRFLPCAVADFFAGVRGATRVELVSTDLPLLLCMEVLFRKPPAAQIPSALLNSEELLYAVRQTGKDAVLVIRNGDARSLVFCRGGDPAALYPAEGESFPEGGTVADQVVAFVQEHGALTLDLYDEIRLPMAPDGGKSFESYLSELATRPTDRPAYVKPTHTVVVRLGPRVVFRWPLDANQVKVGRGADNDIVLDNGTVSRSHALIRKESQGWVMEDKGSDNGLVVGGRKVSRVELSPGTEVGVGKYTLMLSRYVSSDSIERPTPPPVNAQSQHEQTIMMSSVSAAGLEQDGKFHPIRGLYFDIGRAPTAHIRIGGLFVGKIHVRIARGKDGGYHAEHVGGWKAMRINGRKLVEAALKDGDVIEVGGFTFRFRGSAPRGSGTRLGPR